MRFGIEEKTEWEVVRELGEIIPSSLHFRTYVLDAFRRFGIIGIRRRSKLLPLERSGVMRHKSEVIMKSIKDYAEKFILNRRHSPSTTEIADAVGIARGTAYKYLVSMNEKGLIRYDGKQIITDRTEKASTELTSVAILGSVSCGSPLLEEEHIEEYVQLPVSLFGRGSFYIVRANGTSMVDAGISDGDLVLIRQAKDAEDGDIVVALVDNENTLKRFYRDLENHCIRLHPENKSMKDLIVPECEIQEVAVDVIKALK